MEPRAGGGPGGGLGVMDGACWRAGAAMNLVVVPGPSWRLAVWVTPKEFLLRLDISLGPEAGVVKAEVVAPRETPDLSPPRGGGSVVGEGWAPRGVPG